MCVCFPFPSALPLRECPKGWRLGLTGGSHTQSPPGRWEFMPWVEMYILKFFFYFPAAAKLALAMHNFSHCRRSMLRLAANHLKYLKIPDHQFTSARWTDDLGFSVSSLSRQEQDCVHQFNSRSYTDVKSVRSILRTHRHKVLHKLGICDGTVDDRTLKCLCRFVKLNARQLLNSAYLLQISIL